MTSHVIDWFAGIDWGSERHQVCVLNCNGEIIAERAFLHTGSGLAELGTWLASFTVEGRNMAIAIEVPHGPIVDLLLDRGFVVYAINPKQLDRLRDRFSIAGSKDDRRDALVGASGLRTDRHLFRLVQASDPAIVELREWSRLAEELQQDRVRLCNRLRQQLWRYYPQFRRRVASGIMDDGADTRASQTVASLDGFASTYAPSDPQVRRHRRPLHSHKADDSGSGRGH